MFKYDPNPTFTHDVTADVPVDGGFEKQTLKVTFLALPMEELEKFDLTKNKDATDFLNRIVLGFSDITDLKGEPLLFNDKLKAALIGLPYMRAAMMNAYTQAITGARLKN